MAGDTGSHDALECVGAARDVSGARPDRGDATEAVPPWLVDAMVKAGDGSRAPALPGGSWPLLKEALSLAAMGLPLLTVLVSRKPGHPGHSPWAKKPATRDGVYGARTDPLSLAWLVRHAHQRAEQVPECTVALAAALGVEVSGRGYLVAVDVDSQDGLETLESRLGPLPRAGRVETPSGGDHRYCYVPTAVRNSMKIGGVQGVELRGSGLYCVIAGSTPDGRPWLRRWDDVRSLPDLPPQWFDALSSSAQPMSGSVGIASRPATSTRVGAASRAVASVADGVAAKEVALGYLRAMLPEPLQGPEGHVLRTTPGRSLPESISGLRTFLVDLRDRRNPNVIGRHNALLRFGVMVGQLVRDEALAPVDGVRVLLESELWADLAQESSLRGLPSRAHDEMRTVVAGIRYGAGLQHLSHREREELRSTQEWRSKRSAP